ncbi:replication factor A [Babesia caballi]|uniref:Replication factor A n=1 Tax=Babesia caballi TaxID=5871 RepID=A0AAV4M0G9_BABCB|nr:replication factor A [Babesia caballi]
MTEVRRVEGAKLLSSKVMAMAQRKDKVCEGFTTVADLPRLQETAERPAPLPTYAYTTASLVLTFIEKDVDSTLNPRDTDSETYIAGDPSGCISVKFAAGRTPNECLEGQTYIFTDIALVVSRGRLHLEVIEGTRILPLKEDMDIRVCRDNNVSRNRLCEIRHSERSSDMPFVP